VTKSELSVAIIAKNAASSIGRCLESCSAVSEDIVVIIDSSTTDTTASVCRKYKARLYTRKFDNFANQKNYALTHTRNHWVLSLDADEWIDSGLQSELSALVPQHNITAYRLPRKNIIFGKVINHTNWDPHGLVRLFDRRKSDWQGDVHEQIRTKGEISEFFAPIYHENYQTVEEFLTRQDKYSTLEADEKLRLGVRFNLLSALFQPVFEFLRRYLWHAGFLDGWHGFYLSYLMAVYHFSVWVKLWQKSRAV
jgi:glycosyltransferase involved in cell wall biosynthesis